MSRIKKTMPLATKEKGQISLDSYYLWRKPPHNIERLYTQDGNRWRNVVNSIDQAVLCKENLVSCVTNAPWKIVAKDSNKRDELKEDIDYYTDLITDDGEFDYVTRAEWLLGDCLDLPFGAGAETIREQDDPEGKVLYIIPIDGATLFPTLNKIHPVGQRIPIESEPRYFPAHAINRMYYSPKAKMEDRGWGMPPPEKIFISLQNIARGNLYYSKLLLDTPPAGILDLGLMSEESASEWVKAFRAVMTGIDPFKIPVLYEHTEKASFIEFGKNPNDILFDKTMLVFSALVCAGYGISLSDIGLQAASASGETLAGSIRQERRSKNIGHARIKKKWKLFVDRILPKELEFIYTEIDDEKTMAVGKSRLATATALQQMIDSGYISPQEARLQVLDDGLLDISIPEKIPSDAISMEDKMQMNKSPERPQMIKDNVVPSQGGQGEMTVPRSLVLKNKIELTKEVSKKLLDERRDVFTKFMTDNIVNYSKDAILDPEFENPFHNDESDVLDKMINNILFYSITEKGIDKNKKMRDNQKETLKYFNVLLDELGENKNLNTYMREKYG